MVFLQPVVKVNGAIRLTTGRYMACFFICLLTYLLNGAYYSNVSLLKQ